MHTPASHSVPFTFFRLLAILFRYLKKKHCLFLEDKKESDGKGEEDGELHICICCKQRNVPLASADGRM